MATRTGHKCVANLDEILNKEVTVEIMMNVMKAYEKDQGSTHFYAKFIKVSEHDTESDVHSAGGLSSQSLSVTTAVDDGLVPQLWTTSQKER